MGRLSKCPGCKVLKSVDGFGRPGKNCPGPDLAEDETANASVPRSVVDIEENLAPSEATNNAVVTTDHDLLQSLVDSVHRLSNEVLRDSSRDSGLTQVSASSICGSAPFFFTSPSSDVPGYFT